MSMKKLSDYKQEKENEQEEFSPEKIKKLGRIQFLLVILLFIGVVCITELVSMALGKVAGNIALVIIAILIAGWLYKAEIKKWLGKGK